MNELGVGALPICGTDERLKGMLTDRDIVVKVLGAGKDPASVKAGDLAQGEAVTIGADDDADEILRTMTEHKVRRLPVIDGHTLIGIVAQADVARALPDPKVGDLLAGTLDRLNIGPRQRRPAKPSNHPITMGWLRPGVMAPAPPMTLAREVRTGGASSRAVAWPDRGPLGDQGPPSLQPVRAASGWSCGQRFFARLLSGTSRTARFRA